MPDDQFDNVPPEEWESLRRIRSRPAPTPEGEPAEPPAPLEDTPLENGHDSTRPEPFETFDPIRLQGAPVPERSWLIEPLVPRGAATSLSGDGGLGKSLLAMQALTAAAIGRNFLGRQTAPVRTFGVFCEDSLDELHRRQDRINAYYGVDFGDLERMRWACRVGKNSELMVFGENGRAITTVRFEQLQHVVQDFGASLVTIDSLHDVFGGEEINRRQARAFMGLMTRLALSIDGAVIVLQHPSLSGMNSGSGTSGSTAWRNASRSALYLTADPDNPDKRILKTTKANYVAAGGTINLTWREGVFVADDEEPALFKSIRQHGAEGAFLEAFRKLAATGIELNPNRNAGNYAPALILKGGLAPGRTRQQLEAAMLALMTAGKLRAETARRSGHERQFLVETEHAGSHGTH